MSNYKFKDRNKPRPSKMIKLVRMLGVLTAIGGVIVCATSSEPIAIGIAMMVLGSFLAVSKRGGHYVR